MCGRGQSPRKARSLAKEWHPDRFVHRSHERHAAGERMKEINRAYEWLEANRYVFDVD